MAADFALCPRCAATILVGALRCPKCGAAFDGSRALDPVLVTMKVSPPEDTARVALAVLVEIDAGE
jgi:hypothetical protein